MTAEVAALDQLYIRAAFSFDTVLENGFHRLCAHSGTFVECTNSCLKSSCHLEKSKLFDPTLRKSLVLT
jgi:hypothetical protein